MKLQDEIIRMSKNTTALEEQLSSKDYKIEELKKQLSKLQEADKRVEKYIEKNKQLKNIRDELKESLESVQDNNNQ